VPLAPPPHLAVASVSPFRSCVEDPSGRRQHQRAPGCLTAGDPPLPRLLRLSRAYAIGFLR
jgi:hypothetical protein